MVAWLALAASVLSLVVSTVTAVLLARTQRRHQVEDRARDEERRAGEEKARLESAITAAELGAYELQSTYWQLDDHFRSAEAAGMNPSPDCSLHIRQLQATAGVLERFTSAPLPNEVLKHVIAVHGLLEEACNHMAHWSRIPGGQGQVLAHLLRLRHHADVQHEENGRLSLMYLGKPGLPTQPPPRLSGG